MNIPLLAAIEGDIAALGPARDSGMKAENQLQPRIDDCIE